ncbi:hypothetical protein [Streptomyces ehimensis]|uniref:Uncharacterized protein n=1 Tax=Streptomyces ehimensis TaxID=68195 RepID=A0ABV9BE67_9ACTN
MISIPGYTTLATIDPSLNSRDVAYFATLLLSDSGGGLHRVDCDGCTCRGDAFDDLEKRSIKKVSSIYELIRDLHLNWSDLDTEDKPAAKREIYRAIQMAAEHAFQAHETAA